MGEMTLNETLAAQVQEIPEPRITVGHFKRDARAMQDESLQLDYHDERAEDLYGAQERKIGTHQAKAATQSYGTSRASARGYAETIKEDRSIDDQRTVSESRAYNGDNDKSRTRDYISQASGHGRKADIPQTTNTLDLTDLQFEQMCDEFYANGPPLKFRPRRGVKLEE